MITTIMDREFHQVDPWEMADGVEVVVGKEKEEVVDLLEAAVHLEGEIEWVAWIEWKIWAPTPHMGMIVDVVMNVNIEEVGAEGATVAVVLAVDLLA